MPGAGAQQETAMTTAAGFKRGSGMRVAAMVLSALLTMSALAPRAAAAGNEASGSSLAAIPKDAFWGALIGAIVAGSINLIADKESVKYGPSIGIGALGGMGWGIFEYMDNRKSRVGHLDANGAAFFSDTGASRQSGKPAFRFDLYSREF